MASSFSSGGHPATADSQGQSLGLLLAQAGQLSGDGQLRELIEERRGRHGGTGPIWYLAPAQLASLGLGQGEEAVVTPNSAVLTWLQLRFGGRTSTATIPVAWLEAEARALPPAAWPAPLA